MNRSLGSDKTLRLAGLALVGLEVALALGYLLMIVRSRTVPHWLDWNGLRSLPSWLQAAHLFAIGGVALAFLLGRQRMQRPLSWALPLSLALLCLYGGLDEVFKIHLAMKQFDWKGIYLGILVAIPLLCWRDLTWIWRTNRPAVLWGLAGITIFLLGGFGGEALKSVLQGALTGDRLFLAEHLRITVEEFSEVFGETLILFGVAQFAAKELVK